MVMMKDKTLANKLTGEFRTGIKGGRSRAAGKRRRKLKKIRKDGKTMQKMVVLQDKTPTNFLKSRVWEMKEISRRQFGKIPNSSTRRSERRAKSSSQRVNSNSPVQSKLDRLLKIT